MVPRPFVCYDSAHMRNRLRPLWGPLLLAVLVLGACSVFVTWRLDAQAPSGPINTGVGGSPTGSAGGVLSGTYPNPGFASAPTFVGPLTVSTSGGAAITGVISGTSDIFSGAVNAIYWNGRTTMYSPSNGAWQVTNLAKTGFTIMNFGPNTSSFPALKVSTTTLQVRLGDDSGFGTLQGQFASTDGSAGFTGTACTAFKNGLCVTGTP